MTAGLTQAAPDGPLRIIDADTFDVGGVRVRLFGIDAPEIGQPCVAGGQEWDCGSWARDMVRAAFEGQQARCAAIELDRYDRVVATCTVAGRDMGSAIVGDGLAWAYRAYSEAYDLDEKGAAIAERGLWGFDMQRPSDYRAARVVQPPPPPGQCVIKGNISDNGRIYHVPGNRDYGRTSINTAKGERWFCSRAEAESAGWRAARN